jgi:predicted transposase/invertase (TIGR01784 family)
MKIERERIELAKKLYNATNDLIFKMLFGDEKNKDILASFLKSVLDIPEANYEEIYIEDSLLKIENIGDKYGILDIKIKTKSGSIIDVEMQIANDKFMKERIIYYISKMIAEQMGESLKYGKIQKVVSIIIAANHILIKGSNNFHHRFLLRDEKSGIIFTNKLEIDTLEIKKLSKYKEKQTDLIKWLKFMKAETEEELDMLSLQTANTEFRRAIKIVKDLNADEKTRKLAQKQIDQLRFYVSNIDGARDEGIAIGEARGEARGKAEGKAEGKTEERNNAIRNMIEFGIEVVKIAKKYNLSIEEINALKSQI